MRSIFTQRQQQGEFHNLQEMRAFRRPWGLILKFVGNRMRQLEGVVPAISIAPAARYIWVSLVSELQPREIYSKMIGQILSVKR